MNEAMSGITPVKAYRLTCHKCSREEVIHTPHSLQIHPLMGVFFTVRERIVSAREVFPAGWELQDEREGSVTCPDCSPVTKTGDGPSVQEKE